MVSLLEIADLKKTVTVRGADVAVFGVSAQGIAHLFNTFPELRVMMSGRRDSITPDSIVQFAPAAIAAIIAAGTGNVGDKDAEAVAARLTLGEQLNLLSAIFELTFPQGVGPFVEQLEGLGILRVSAAASGKEADTKSPAPSKPSATDTATLGK
jgi:hypothetical protein